MDHKNCQLPLDTVCGKYKVLILVYQVDIVFKMTNCTSGKIKLATCSVNSLHALLTSEKGLLPIVAEVFLVKSKMTAAQLHPHSIIVRQGPFGQWEFVV